jgi:rhodanese-related sulfurtransferase
MEFLMGPFVPEPISDQLNLLVALLLGIGFGYVLEQAGFSSSRKLAGLFYGYDFTVLRVFFTAAVTAMCGVILLGYFGWLDTDAIFVNPTWLWPAVVGGVIMGFGFILGGYCPGTSICAAAIGKVDAMFFVGGGILGIFAFGEFYPLTRTFYDSSAMGPIKVYESLGMSQGLFAFALIVIAVMAFAVTTMIEKRVNPGDAPSLKFTWSRHVAAGLAVIVIGGIILFLPDRKTDLIGKVSSDEYQKAHVAPVMEIDELAFRIVDREPKIQIIDVRSAEEYSPIALPGSKNVAIRDFFSKESSPLFAQRHVKKVVVGADEAQERTACGLLHELGYENIAILQGGMPAFASSILQPSVFVPTGSRWDADVRQFREQARTTIQKMIEEGKKAGVKETKKAKKIQGGC